MKLENIDLVIAVVTHPHSYYVFTTFDTLNLSRFATFCLFCDCLTKLAAATYPTNRGKTGQTNANQEDFKI